MGLEAPHAIEKTVNRLTAHSNMSFVPSISLSFAKIIRKPVKKPCLSVLLRCNLAAEHLYQYMSTSMM